LSEVVESLIEGKKLSHDKKNILNTGLTILPRLEQDQTDRNRTSPFAFTGNKFEFRACGSSANVATSLMVINTIVADSLNDLSDRIEKELTEKRKIDEALPNILKEVLSESRKILFEGNGYSDEWKQEAVRRGLSNICASAQALKAFVSDEAVSLFERTGVLTSVELKARYAIWLELYNKILEIEANTMKELVQTAILPSAYDFQTDIGNSLQILSELADDNEKSIPLPIGVVDDRIEMFSKLSGDIYEVRKHLAKLKEMLLIVDGKDDEEKADYLYNDLNPHIEQIRRHIDQLEINMPDDMWKLPKYREMLFNL
jgi:glutamine synthetase